MHGFLMRSSPTFLNSLLWVTMEMAAAECNLLGKLQRRNRARVGLLCQSCPSTFCIQLRNFTFWSGIRCPQPFKRETGLDFFAVIIAGKLPSLPTRVVMKREQNHNNSSVEQHPQYIHQVGTSCSFSVNSATQCFQPRPL